MGKRRFPTTAEAIEEVRSVYRELAGRPIERSCELRTNCCRFALTGKTPYLTRGEALVAASAFRATGRRKLPASPDGACPLLDAAGRCLIYANRPFGCRTHFCKAAGGDYPRRDVIDLIRRLEDLGERLGEPEARPLPAAVADALAEL